MDRNFVDGYAEPLIEEVSRHLKWVDRGELRFEKSSDYFATMLADRLAKVPAEARVPVLQRLVSYGHYLEREQRATEASRTFMTGLSAATGGQLPTGAHVQAQQTKSGTWTFQVGRGPARRSASRAGRTVSVKGFRAW